MNINIFNFLFSFSSHPEISKLALFVSYPFTYGFIILLLIWTVVLSHKKMYDFSLFFLSGIVSWGMASLLKVIFKLNRPFVDLGIIPLYNEAGFSFPSEHMAIFTAITVSMFLINRRVGYIFSLIAILVGVSRIIIGVHYPIDILGGFFVGLITSLVLTKIFKKV